MHTPVFDLVLIFFIYACLGWGCEVAFAACKEGKFINRGFLNGPVCPIYGFGVIGVTLALAPVRDNLLLLYLGSVVLASLVEFVTGFTLEKLFHARWWDYSDMPLNIMGHVCLLFSMVWGVACVAIVMWLHPLVTVAVAWLPDGLCIALDVVFAAVFLLDLGATVSAVRKLSDRLRRLTELGAELHGISDEMGRMISDKALAARRAVQEGGENLGARKARLQQQFEQLEGQLAEWMDQQRGGWSEAMRARLEGVRARFDSVRGRFAHILEERGFGQRRLLDAFPNLRSERYQDAIESLRAFYDRLRPGNK